MPLSLTVITRWIIAALLFYLPLDFGAHHPRPLLILKLTALVLVSAWLLFRHPAKPLPRIIAVSGWAFLCLSLIASGLASAPYESLSQWLNWLAYAIFFWLAYQSFTSDTDSQLGVYALMMASGFFALRAINIYVIMITAGYHAALYGTFYQADMAAAFLLAGSLLGLSLYLGTSGNLRLLGGLIALICSTALFLTFSRGGWFSFLGGALLLYVMYLWWAPSRWRRYTLQLLLLGLLIWVSAWLITLPQGKAHLASRVQTRAQTLVSGEDSSVSARWYFWKGALKLCSRYPLLGIGFDAFGRYYPQVEDNVRYFSRYVHNSYLELGCEAGLPALAAFIACLLALGYYSFRGLKSIRGPETFPYVAGLLIASLAGLAHSFIDVDFKFAALPFYLAVMLGMACSRVEVRAAQPVSPARRFSGWLALLLLFPVITWGSADIINKTIEELPAVKDPSQILAGLRRSIALAPIQSLGYKLRADWYFRQWEASGHGPSLKQALQDARLAVRWDRHRAAYRFFLAQLYLAQGQEQEFLASMREALALDAVNYPMFYNELGNYWRTKGQGDAALKLYQDIAGKYADFNWEDLWSFRLEPLRRDLSITYSNIGDLYTMKHDYRAAREAYVKALRLNPQNSGGWLGMGIAAYHSGRYHEALAHLLQAESYGLQAPELKALITAIRVKLTP